jgi:hypothetical protein
MHETAKHPRVFPLDTECAICGRMYAASERASIGANPNACSGVCLRALPTSVHTKWTLGPAGFVQWHNS